MADNTGTLITLGIVAVGGYLLYENWDSISSTLFPSSAAPAAPVTGSTQSSATQSAPQTTPATSGGTAQGVTQTAATPLSASFANGSVTVTGPAGSSVMIGGVNQGTIGANGSLTFAAPLTPGVTYPITVTPPGGSMQLVTVTAGMSGLGANRIPAGLIHRGRW
jgi:hypothetical protein